MIAEMIPMTPMMPAIPGRPARQRKPRRFAVELTNEEIDLLTDALATYERSAEGAYRAEVTALATRLGAL